MEIKTVEVKNISHYARGLEETPCYNATVYINGKKAIEVGNDGHGGMDKQHTYPNIEERGLVQQVNEWCVNKFGQKSFTYKSDDGEKECFYDIDLEHYCHIKLYEWLDTKLLKKSLSKEWLFFEDKELRAYKIMKKETIPFADFFKKRHPKGVLLNNLPFIEALKIYKECA